MTTYNVCRRTPPSEGRLATALVQPIGERARRRLETINKLQLIMVPFAPIHLRRAVELLQQDHPRQGVWQGDGAKGDEGIRPRQHLRGEPQRAAEDEGYVTAPRETQGVHPVFQLLRGERLALLPVQRDHVRPRGYRPEELPSLGGEHLLGRAPVQVFLRHLDDLYREVPPEPFQVISAALVGPSLQSADRDNGGTPDHRGRLLQEVEELDPSIVIAVDILPALYRLSNLDPGRRVLGHCRPNPNARIPGPF